MLRLRMMSWLVAAFLGAAIPQMTLAAPDYAGQVTRQLQAQGYHQIEVRRTLLGKILITAEGRDHRREVVLDPRNGALLRDLVRQAGGDVAPVGIARVGGGNAGSGRDGDPDDDDGRGRGGDDPADDPDDDDRRHGGDDSGHGGGDGGGDDGDGSDDGGGDDGDDE